MKKYQIYRNIRKEAVIFGLSISFFALMMVSIIASLLVIIFSFSFWLVISVLIFNCTLYVGLIKFHSTPLLLFRSAVFPAIISNRKNSGIYYEQD